MKTQKIFNTDLEVSNIIYGCMDLGQIWGDEPLTKEIIDKGLKAINTALDEGINFFDTADIYARGKSDLVFSEIFKEKPGLRDKIILQTKCGIRFGGEPNNNSPHRFDFSYEHIINSLNSSLKRLKTDYLDILLLHRPDPLIEPEEVAKAFDELKAAGKVKYFGVSNHTAFQIQFLQNYLDMPLIVNQIEMNVVYTDLIDEGIVGSKKENLQKLTGGGTIEYCRMNKIQLQAWSPLAQGLPFKNENEIQEERIKKTAGKLSELSKAKGVSKEAIATAWLLRHPAKIQPVIGTRNPDRIKAICEATKIELTREEWYQLYNAQRRESLP